MSETAYNNKPNISKSLRNPPQNVDAEKALLGAIILKPEVMHDVFVTVYTESFYADKHREIFKAILDIFSKGDPVDILSVSSKLKDRKVLDRVGGASYITELVETVPASSNAIYYAELVQNKSILRGLIHAADDIAELAYSDPENTEEAMDVAEKKIYQVTNATSTRKFTHVSNTIKETWEQYEKLSQSDETHRGVPTGFTSLDNLLSGLQKSDLIIIAARPSVGKTTFALDIARNAALRFGKSVGFFSLEMANNQIVERMLAAEAGINSWHLRTGNLNNDEEYQAFQDAMSKMSEMPFYIIDEPALNILKMRSAARRLKNEHGLDLIIVDYLQLMSPTSTKASDSMVQQITEISRSLKILARELDVPVVALSQLSRAVEQRGGKPRLSDLRDSGSIEQDADVVMFIHREDKTDRESDRPNIAEILIEKHRNGPVGYTELYFDDKHVRFLSLDTQHKGGGMSKEDNNNDDF